jgi:hypothetical protein
MDVYIEMLYRLLTTKGIAFTTFTPLMGRSEVVNSFLEITDEQRIELSKYLVQAGWDDVPHLDEQEKKRLLATTPAYQVLARTKGEPTFQHWARARFIHFLRIRSPLTRSPFRTDYAPSSPDSCALSRPGSRCHARFARAACAGDHK